MLVVYEVDGDIIIVEGEDNPLHKDIKKRNEYYTRKVYDGAVIITSGTEIREY